MKISAIDIQQQTFRHSLRGLDESEVRTFLDLVAAQVEDLTREQRELIEAQRHLERELTGYREREQALKETMVTAQRVTEDLKEQAKKEAEVIISQAELKAEKIMHNAHGRMVQILEEINELKRQRTRFTESLRGILSTHTKLLDLQFDLESAAANNEGNVAVFSRPAPPAPPVVESTERQFDLQQSRVGS